MEPLRRQAIADYLSRLHAGLDDLVSRSRDVRAAYEAELASMSNEMARYRELIANAERESEQETALSRGKQKRFHADVDGSSEIRTVVREGSNRPRSRSSKRDSLRSAAENILRASNRPLKRADLTRELQSRGLLSNSEYPIDLVRKLLQDSEVIGYDAKKGYFLLERDA